MANPLNNKIFQDPTKAREWLEGMLWADGRSCGYCGVVGESTPMKGRDGYYQCKACRKQFTVMVGTLFERSHIPLNKWLMAAFLLCASKKGISAHQMHRMLGITYKSAWFMMHRLREAMRQGDLAVPFGSTGGAVEADETYIGKKAGVTKRRGGAYHKMKVLTLIDRETKQAKSTVLKGMHVSELAPIVRKNIAKEARLMTDEANHYRKLGQEFADHQFVTHGLDEYVRGDAYTNTAEGFFSIFKRGMKGIYQHCQEKHLHRYLAEFDFRYNHREALDVNDLARASLALRGSKGKRLTYRSTHSE